MHMHTHRTITTAATPRCHPLEWRVHKCTTSGAECPPVDPPRMARPPEHHLWSGGAPHWTSYWKGWPASGSPLRSGGSTSGPLL